MLRVRFLRRVAKWRAAGFLGCAAILLFCALFLVISPVAFAGNPSGFGNGNFNGIGSTQPEGYIEPPAAYNSGEVVTYNFSLTNTTSEPVMFNLVWNITRILKLGSLDLADGTADVAGITFKENWQQAAPQVLVYSEPKVISLQPGEVQQFSFTWKSTECGYYQIDLGRDVSGGFEVVNSGYIRVVNCQPAQQVGGPIVETAPPAKPGVQQVVPQTSGLLPLTGSLDGLTRNLLIGALIAGGLLMFGAFIRLRLSR
jgi:hypothetical protein